MSEHCADCGADVELHGIPGMPTRWGRPHGEGAWGFMCRSRIDGEDVVIDYHHVAGEEPFTLALPMQEPMAPHVFILGDQPGAEDG